MALTIEQQSAYYESLLAWLYRGLPKATGTIRAYAIPTLADLIAFQLQTAFVLDTAIGAQLDILGKYIGLPRNIGDPIALPYFGFVSSVGADPQNTNGFRSTDNSLNAGVIFYNSTYAGTQLTDLTDLQYRFMLKLKIGLNNLDGSLASIQQFLYDFFLGYITVTDNANMTLTYHISDNTPVSATVLRPYLPKPLGVGIIIDALFIRVLMDGTTERVTSTGDTRVATS